MRARRTQLLGVSSSTLSFESLVDLDCICRDFMADGRYALGQIE